MVAVATALSASRWIPPRRVAVCHGSTGASLVGDAVTFTLTEGGAVDLQGAWGMVDRENLPIKFVGWIGL